MAEDAYTRMRSGNGTKPVRSTAPPKKKLSAGQKLDKGVDKYLKKHPGKAGYGDSEDYELGPADDTVESPGLYRKGLRQLGDDNNPSGSD